ncbi:MAG: UTP--glucose-1-phosphate uridylyltransferase GalU [Pseudomonadales bacterium]|jgi:UTP--glucose-1-phosphate uridylyltransferase|nr:UTP--glucose-1-phosphate uridylyltransferase GalU [Pseudomonadales bacterium]
MLRKCLFPAAGYGTRFLPATKAMPKEMMPIVNKPLIQYGVEEAINADLNYIGFISGRGKRAIEDHFDISFELEHQIAGTSKEDQMVDIRDVIDKCTFSYTRQKEMRGLGDAILTGEELIGEEPFAVLLADDLCINGDDGVLLQMERLYRKFQCTIVAIQDVPADQTQNYGIVKGDEIEEGLYRVETMVEKPAPAEAPSNHAIIGRYILTPDIFDILRHTPPGRGGEIQITDAMMEQAQQGRVLAYKFHGRRFDCGSFEGFVAATNYVFETMHCQ